MRLVALVLAFAGCDGVFGLTHITSVPDAVDAPGIDASTICAHDAPFTTMERVPGLSDSTSGEIDVWLSRDELRGIVTIGGPSQSSSLRYVMRGDRSSPFLLGTSLAVNARSTTVGAATLMPDGLTLYYEAFYANATGFDIERAVSPAPGVDFMSSVSVPELNFTGGIYDQAPTINDAGDRIYWVSSRSGEYDVWSARWSGNTWSDVTSVYATVMRFERYLVPSRDDLALYHGSSANGLGSYELRVVTRADTSQPYGQPVLVTLPMTVTSATPSWLSDDYCRLYLASMGDVWLATRTP